MEQAAVEAGELQFLIDNANAQLHALQAGEQRPLASDELVIPLAFTCPAVLTGPSGSSIFIHGNLFLSDFEP